MQRILVVGDMKHQYMLGFIQALSKLQVFELHLLDTSDPSKPLSAAISTNYVVHTWRKVDRQLGEPITSSKSFYQYFKGVIDKAGCEAVLFQYLRVYHLPAIILTKYRGIRSIVALWGSDINKASHSKKLINYASLRLCNNVICGEPNMQRHLLAQGIPPPKLSVCYFGTNVGKSLLHQAKQSPRLGSPAVEQSRDRLLRIAIGTSASVAQQHEKIIESLTTAIPVAERSQCHLVVPMSYAGTPEYVSAIERLLSAGNWGYTLIRSFITSSELADLRLSTDIYINLQTSDSFSGSMRENMLLGNYIIYGSWLDYSFIPYPRSRFSVVGDISEVGQVVNRFLQDRSLLPVQQIFSWFEQTLDWDVAISDWASVLQLPTKTRTPNINS